ANGGVAMTVLKNLNVDPQVVREEILKAFASSGAPADDAPQEKSSTQGGEKMSDQKKSGKKSVSTSFVVNLGAFFLLAVAGLVAYSTALDGKFLYDDSWLVGGNPFFKSPIFIFEVFRHYLFLDSLSYYYRPVQNISYMLDYWLWNSDEFGYHLANVFYHVLVACLLYVLLRKLLPGLTGEADWRKKGDLTKWNTFLAFVVSLVWVVHPIHNAAVAYVAGRADSLACIFSICAWLLYMAGGKCRSFFAKAPIYFLAIFCFVMGLCSKEIAIIWMLVFLMHLFVFNKDRTIQQKLGATFGAAVALGFYYFYLHRLPGVTPFPGSGPGAPPFDRRLVLMLRALGDYTWLIFWPNNLHMDRFVLPGSEQPSLTHWNFHDRLQYLSSIGIAMILVFVVMCFKKLPGQRLRIFAALWFILGFLPISNLFPLNAQVAEHWIYMPSMGLLLFFAGCVLPLQGNGRKVCAVIALVAVVPLTARTAMRAYEWADPERFFTATIKSGGGSDRINLNLAMIYFNRKDYPHAEAMMRDIVKHDPSYIPAKLDLGSTLLKEGKDKEAEEFLTYDKDATKEISKQFVHTWTAAVSVAGIRLKEKKYDEALALANDAMEQYPDVWEVRQFKATVLHTMGRDPEAIALVKEYTDTHWWHYASFSTLAWLYEKSGDPTDAIAAYRHTALLDIHDSKPFFAIARVDMTLPTPDLEAAVDAQKKGLARQPDQPTQWFNLSVILDRAGHKDEAAAALRHAEELRRSVVEPGEENQENVVPPQ
ncbi:MAG TPA: tetratricopeptide repeat protein, partial [Chthoniobacteraceae bacterium]|nr:tetratricopeptide repeat protein [Chthoniobacteraceae bacterium]